VAQQFGIGGIGLGRHRHVPARHRLDALGAHHESRPGRTFHQSRHGLHHAPFQVRPLGRERTGEGQPDLAVVVVVTVEVLADEHPQARADPTREQRPQQQHQRRAQEGQLRHGPPTAAEEPHVVTGGGHDQQIGSAAEQRRRMEQHLARYLQAQRPARIAQRRDGDQRHRQRIDKTARGPGIGAEVTEQQRIAVEIEVIGEHQSHAQAGELDAPALRIDGIAIELLDQEQAEDGRGRAQQRHRRELARLQRIAIAPRYGQGAGQLQPIEGRHQDQPAIGMRHRAPPLPTLAAITAKGADEQQMNRSQADCARFQQAAASA
ncbi:conserved hypothetical protein, partial [Ricinus communis]